MRMKKIGLLVMALALVLGLTGAGFATWSQDLTIVEEVNTGTLKVGIRDAGTDDSGETGAELDDYKKGSLDTGWEYVGDVFKEVSYDKNVASCNSANITPKCKHGDVQYYHKVKETIKNAYPGYAPTMTLELANCGSIPVKIQTISETASGNLVLLHFTKIAYYKIERDGKLVFEFTGPKGGWTSLVEHLIGIQIDPCEVLTLTITKYIDQELNDGTECPMGKTITYTEVVTFVQWNKYVAP